MKRFIIEIKDEDVETFKDKDAIIRSGISCKCCGNNAEFEIVSGELYLGGSGYWDAESGEKL